jgi:hypothetical protein
MYRWAFGKNSLKKENGVSGRTASARAFPLLWMITK